MRDISNKNSLDNVWSLLAYQAQAADISEDMAAPGQLITLFSPRSGVGTSYVTRELAMVAARRTGERVLIVDMDIQRSAQSSYFFSPEAEHLHGVPQGPYDASFGMVPFWRVTPSMVDENGGIMTDAHFMSLHIADGANLAFTQFHWEKFRRGQTVHIQAAHEYWQVLRQHFKTIFVDLPALDRSDILSTICAEADQNIIVSSQAEAGSRLIGDVYSKVKALNGECAGLVINELPRGAALYGGR